MNSVEVSQIESRNEIKSLIEAAFAANVLGRLPDLTGYNSAHDGAEGDWLTKQMGLKVNGLNEPDFHGFEMKKDSRGKTTFGDWSPDTAIFKGRSKRLLQDDFLAIFGSPNPKKGDRYSWSGSVFPKVGKFNSFGQTLSIDEENSISAIYNHSLNLQSASRIPSDLRHNDLEIAHWGHTRLKLRLERKFNQLGWFRCLKDSSGKYDRIQFGLPINIETFMPLFRAGTIYIDCGMYQGNTRPYMQFRANNNLWNSLAE